MRQPVQEAGRDQHVEAGRHRARRVEQGVRRHQRDEQPAPGQPGPARRPAPGRRRRRRRRTPRSGGRACGIETPTPVRDLGQQPHRHELGGADGETTHRQGEDREAEVGRRGGGGRGRCGRRHASGVVARVRCAQESEAMASLNVFDGRMTCCGLGVVGPVVAPDVGRLTLDADQLLVDRVPRSRRASRPAPRRPRPARRRRSASPAPGPSRAPGRSASRGCRSSRPCAPATCSRRGTCRSPGRACRPAPGRACCRCFCARCSKLTARARNSPRLSQRR